MVEAPGFTNYNESSGVCMLPRERLKSVVLTLLGLSGLGATLAARAADQPPPEIPTCDKKIGTLAVTEPEKMALYDAVVAYNVLQVVADMRGTVRSSLPRKSETTLMPKPAPSLR